MGLWALENMKSGITWTGGGGGGHREKLQRLVGMTRYTEPQTATS